MKNDPKIDISKAEEKFVKEQLLVYAGIKKYGLEMPQDICLKIVIADPNETYLGGCILSKEKFEKIELYVARLYKLFKFMGYDSFEDAFTKSMTHEILHAEFYREGILKNSQHEWILKKLGLGWISDDDYFDKILSLLKASEEEIDKIIK